MNTLPVKRIYAVGAVSLILGVVFDYLFYDKWIGISFSIYIALLLISLFGFIYFFKTPHDRAALWFVPIITFFSLMVGVREIEFLTFFNVVLVLGLLLLLASRLIGRNVKKFIFLDYLKTAILLPLNMLGRSFSALGRMISAGKGLGEGGRSSQITKGILITLPIVIFFLFLFSAADLVFNKLVTDVFSFNFMLDADVTAQIWLAVVLGLIWLGVFTYISESAKNEKTDVLPVATRRYRFGNIEAGILLTTLSALFLTFVIIQVRYLFAGHEAITQLGYTYSEYVHKGFGELIFVALLSFGLIFLAERYIERQENRPSILFKALTGFMIFLVLVIMASAFMRLSVYEQAYGFTVERILVQAFIIWLAAVFLWLVYKIMRGLEDRPFIFGMFLSVIGFFIAFNLLNPEAFAARKNIDGFLLSGELDSAYLASLSADAVPALLPLLDRPGVKDNDGNELSVEIASALKDYYDSMSGQDWQSYNVSRNRALRLIGDRWEQVRFLAAQDSSDSEDALIEE